MKILNDLAKFYKRNKKAVNIGGLIIIGCLLFYGVMGFFTENTSSPIYGNRTEQTSKVKINNNNLKEYTKKLQENDKVEKAKVTIEGNIINVVVTVSKGTSIDDAKKAASEIKSLLNEDELKAYDLELYVSNADDSNNSFPIIGHEKAGKDNISWTKNR